MIDLFAFLIILAAMLIRTLAKEGPDLKGDVFGSWPLLAAALVGVRS